jgi:hypothetical protein
MCVRVRACVRALTYLGGATLNEVGCKGVGQTDEAQNRRLVLHLQHTHTHTYTVSIMRARAHTHTHKHHPQ